jgi:type VI secretion system secreted protein Hcp
MAKDFFLKIDGIEGESHDAKHEKEIEISTFNFGAQQTGSYSAGGGGGSGKVHMQDFHFSVPTNKASPKLFLACANGDHIPKAVLTCRKAGKEQREFLTYTFGDVLVSSYTTTGRGHDGIPLDQISLAFTNLEIDYKEQKQDGTLLGSVKAGYDVKKTAEKT